MDEYVVDELQRVVAENVPAADLTRQGITGHSMGGHGALTLHLQHPQRYRSVSAFSPIVAPSQVPWGQKAFTAYLGSDRATWQRYDATELVKKQHSAAHILIDQGAADQFLERELQPQRFVEAASSAGQQVTLRMQEGYDHSYYFVSTFIDDHLRWHAQAQAQ
jgi:S-formylglutathione hydrolase